MTNFESVMKHIDYLHGRAHAQNSFLLAMLRSMDVAKLPTLHNELGRELEVMTNSLLHSETPDAVHQLFAEHMRHYALAIRMRAEEMGVEMP